MLPKRFLWSLLVGLTLGTPAFAKPPPPPPPPPAAAAVSPENAALVDAVMKGDVAAVTAAIANKADVNGTDAKGVTMLGNAAANDQSAVVDALLTAGATVDGKSKGGLTPLMYAAMMGQSASIDVLLKHGADVKAKNDAGMGVLSLAAFSGAKAANIKTLVTAGADPNERDPNAQDTPFLWAAMAAPTAADRAATIASYKAFLPPAPWLDQPATAFSGPADILQALVDAGADPKAVNKAGQGAFSLAVAGTAKGYPETLQKLVALGVPVDAKAVDDTTALCLATQAKKLDAMKALMAAGADKNAICGKGNLGATPLMFASENGALDVAQVLVDGGADVNVVRQLLVSETYSEPTTGEFGVFTHMKSWTALDLSVEAQKNDVVTYLKGKGAKPAKSL